MLEVLRFYVENKVPKNDSSVANFCFLEQKNWFDVFLQIFDNFLTYKCLARFRVGNTAYVFWCFYEKNMKY